VASVPDPTTEPAASAPQPHAAVIKPKSTSPHLARPKPGAVQEPAAQGADAARAEATVAGTSHPQPAPEAEKREPSEPVATPAQPPAPKPAGPTAFLSLAISPWGEVFVDGKSAGVSPPLTELELSAGKHRIEIRNGAFKPYQEDIELGSNQTFRIKHSFRQQR
jgi:serine/threonine-protein kinase